MPDGLTLNSTPMDLVARLESDNRNIPQRIHDVNTDRGTPAGGFFQIIDPTWRAYAAKAGVDLSKFPSAMSAPRDVQAQVASAIPFDQWGPRTVAGVRAAYPGLNIHQPLGAIQAAYSAPAATGAMDPSIMARGGVSSPAVATPSPPAPTFVQNLGKGDVGAALQQLTANKTDKDGNEQPGTSALAGLAGIAKPKQQAAAPQPAMIQPAGDSTAAIGPAASQLFSTLLANSAKPLSWSTRPMGSDAGPQGTTLNGVPYV